MNFGVISLSQLNKHSLDSLYFSQGHISPFTRFSIFFLGSTEQYKAMKIGITFFGSKLDLLCISKVLTIFCVFSKIRWKKKRSRGHVAGSPSARDSLSVWGSRGSAHSESSREGLSGLGHAGHVAGSGASGDSPGRGTREQVSCSEDSRIWLTGWTLGDRCRVRRLPGQLSLAGLAAHSGASERVSCKWVLGTRVALAGF